MGVHTKSPRVQMLFLVLMVLALLAQLFLAPKPPQAQPLLIGAIALAIGALYLAFRHFRHTRQLFRNLALLEQYRRVTDESAYVSKTDPKGVITYANDRFAQISGYTKEELIGQPHSIVRHPDMPESAFRQMWQTIQSKKVWHGVIKNRNRSGKAYFVESTISPIVDDRGEIVEYIALRYDVTAREEALRQARAAREARDRFLANMSHEIRTPLNAILGFVDLLSEEIADNPKAFNYLQTIDRNGKTLLAVINDVLDFAKIESGELEIEPIACTLQGEIRSVVDLFSASAAQKQIPLEEIWDDPFPEQVVVDPFRLRQILGNLLSNAIKFTPPGAVITVRAGYDFGAKRLAFSVIDEGPGIDPKWHERIFDAFLQVRGSDSTLHGGTGLGLPISRSLARRMGGDITLRSQIGEGSTFVVWLPAEHRSAPQTSPSDRSGAQALVKGLKVLIVEDQPDNQLLIRLLMERMGFAVRMTSSGEEALEALVWGRFDLLLLDENMPGLSGTETMKKMRQRGVQAPIVVLTANAVKGDRERFLEAGFDAYLSKPIQKEALERVVQQVLK